MSDQDTPVVEDTNVPEPADTTNDDVALEDIEISLDDEEDNEEESPASEEATEEVVEEAEEEAEEQSEAEPEATEEPEVIDPETERKRFNDEMAKQRIAEREAKQQAKQAQAALEAERLQNYLAEAQDDADEYARRELNIEAYKIQQERANLNAERLEVGIDKAITGIDLFRTGSPAVKEELLSAVDEFEDMYVVKDQAGNPIEVKADLNQFLQKKADSIKRLIQEGAASEAKTKEMVKARTMATPSRAPKQVKADPDIDAFDEEANRW